MWFYDNDCNFYTTPCFGTNRQGLYQKYFQESEKGSYVQQIKEKDESKKILTALAGLAVIGGTVMLLSAKCGKNVVKK